MKKKYIFSIALFFIICGSCILKNNFTSVTIDRAMQREAELKIDSENYYIENKLIKPVILETMKDEFVSAFSATNGILNLDCNNGTDYVGTACNLQTKIENDVTSSYPIVVYGDVTGDGKSSITDMVKMAIYSENKTGLETDAHKEAADIDYDENISISDATSLANHYMQDVAIPLPNSKDLETVIELSTTNISIEKNSSQKIIATTNKGDVTIVNWKSNDENIATVDSTGLVTAVNAGTTTITVTASDNTTKNLEVNVYVVVPVTGVSLNVNKLSLYEGSSETLVATVSPVDATNKNVTWKSSNEEVATVSNGTINALKEGTTTITVTTEDGEYNAECALDVKKPIHVTDVTLDISDTFIKMNTDQTLTATVLPATATNKNVTWRSSDYNVATVENGIVKANSRGVATITVTTEDGHKEASCKVTVGYYGPDSITTSLDFDSVKGFPVLQLDYITKFKTRDNWVPLDDGNEFQVDNAQGFTIRKNADGYHYFWVALNGSDDNDAKENIVLLRYKFTKDADGNVVLHNFDSTKKKTSSVGPFALGHGNDMGYDRVKNKVYITPAGYSEDTCPKCSSLYRGLYKFDDHSTVDESVVFPYEGENLRPGSFEIDSENRLFYIRNGNNFYTYAKGKDANDIDDTTEATYIEHFEVNLGKTGLIRNGMSYFNNKIYYSLYCGVNSCNVKNDSNSDTIITRGNIIHIIDVTYPNNSKNVYIPKKSLESGESGNGGELESIAFDEDGDAYLLINEQIDDVWYGVIYKVNNKEVLELD